MHIPKAKNVKSEFWFKKFGFKFTPFKWKFGKGQPNLNTISRFIHVYRNWSFGPFHFSWRDEVILQVEPTSENKRKWFIDWLSEKKNPLLKCEKNVNTKINFAKRV